MNSHRALRILSGGGLISSRYDQSSSVIEIFVFSLLLLIIKGLLVMVTYNIMAPRIIKNFNPEYSPYQFQQITIWEGILLVILFTNLSNRW